jgi:succinyl-CoA synthetase beta subunit
MKIHEYQAKELLRAYDVPVPRGQVAYTPEEAKSAYEQLGSALAVVKAQIHAGGRGKGGGVKLVRSGEEAHDAAKAILSKPLITHQTGPQGQPVRVLLIEEGSAIAKELYVGLAVDRALGCPVMMASSEGGMDVEEVAATHPEKILKEPVDPSLGLSAYQARRLAFGIGVPAAALGQAVKIMQALARLFIDKDCSLAEINPLIVTKDGEVMALDAKMNFDDNALYRHRGPRAAARPERRGSARGRGVEVRPQLHRARRQHRLHGERRRSRDGTMDIIKLHGGSRRTSSTSAAAPTSEQVTERVPDHPADKNVKAMLVNIFGGIMKCDTIADGVIAAYEEHGFTVPLVVRLEGTNVKLGSKMLAESGLALITAASDLDRRSEEGRRRGEVSRRACSTCVMRPGRTGG